MAYFRNRNINFVYLHIFLQGIAFHGGESFAFVFLLKAGLTIPVALLASGLMYAGRIVLRQAVVPFVKMSGLRNGLLFGIVMEAIAFLILANVTRAGPLLVVYLFFQSLSSSFYWTTMHAFIASTGDQEHRGKQVSTMEFINSVLGIITPAFSGLLLSLFPPIVAFSVVSAAMLASGIPFLFVPNTAIPENAILPPAKSRQARIIMFTDGLRAAFFHFTWLLVLFETLGENFASFGGALAFSGLIGGAFGLIAGKSIDLGHGQRARQFAYGAMALAGIARAFGYPLPWPAILANAVAAIAWPMYGTVLNGRLYDLAKQSPCTLRYHVVAEGGWDMGTAIGCFAAAAMIALGLSYFWPLILSLAASAIGYWVLSRSFGVAATVKIANHPSS